jgi:hypothetical protein
VSHKDITTQKSTHSVISELNYELLADKYVLSSLNYDSDLANFEVFCSESIRIHKMWSSRDILVSVLHAIAKQHG